MENPQQDHRGENSPNQSPRRGGPAMVWMVTILLGVTAILLLSQQKKVSTEIEDINFFKKMVLEDRILKVEINETTIEGVFKDPLPDPPARFDDDGNKMPPAKGKDGENLPMSRKFKVVLPRSSESVAALEKLIADKGIPTKHNIADNSMMFILTIILLVPLGLVLLFWLTSVRRNREQLMGGGFLSGFSKSPAKRYEATQQAITFKDVAGIEGVKADLMEIVEYLKSPEKFQRLGGRVPKGVLLNGAPGTGKTLLARAVAGESGVPFFSVNGSEFIQMFVGVGASRVRDLFKNAKETAPSIMFIDEIDAVGRQRGAGLGGGHDEREQTLNQILSEMDGFNPTDSVIVIAATNRPDVLDPALLRPGRFDRHVTVGRPTHRGRAEIFKVHVREVPLAEDVDLDKLASGTIGLTGADIRNIVNEAALWAARSDKQMVTMSDFEYARDKILMGAKREEVLKEDEKEKTAFHEAGHTLTAWLLPGANRVHKVTVIPRGRALGVTQMLPTEDRFNRAEHELLDELVVLLGGRAAERLVYGEMTAGAENDLERATAMARRMVTHWGMSGRLGPVSYKMSDDDPFLGREIHQQRQFSEHTMEIIDSEVTRILHEAQERATKLISEHREKLNAISAGLMEHEELGEDDIAGLIGPSVHHGSDTSSSVSQVAKDSVADV